MNRAERWHRISALFDRVVELPAPDREVVLAVECADDPQLRAEVERLLQADERTSPVDQDIAGQASHLLLEGDPHEHEGQQFGPYRIVKLLGQGGMGRVYLAERDGEDFAQTVALKLVGGYGNFDAYTARRRFLDERRILARLQHPNIARLLDGGVGPEAQPWFAMEFVDGAPLTDWCDHQHLDVRQRLTLFGKVCEAVDHAHRFLIVHRDLKPGNVLVDHRGEPKVLDFGIAKLLDEGGPSDRTGSTILMTPDYAAPEQIRGGQISTATDVYALGAVLFEVLTGRKPFVDPLAPRAAPQASKAATEGQHTGERALARSTTPQALRKHLRGDIDRILRTALDPEPSRRYRSAATLAQDLRAVAEGKAISLRSDRTYRIGVFLRRHKWETAAATAAVLALLGTTGLALWQMQHATRQSELAAAHAREEARQAAIAKKEALAAEKVSNLLVAAFDAANPGERSTAAEPTAKSVLEAGVASIDEELSDTPEVKARMQMVLGRAYMNMGKSEQSVQLLRAAIDGFLNKDVDKPLAAAEGMYLLAIAEMNRERLEESIALSRQALALYKQAGAPLDDISSAYSALGMALIAPGHFDEAIRVFDEHRSIVKAIKGDPSKAMSGWMSNRGRLATVAGHMQEAEKWFNESMAMKLRLNEGEQSLYRTRGMLAIALAEMGRFSEAEQAFTTNLDLVPVFYGKESIHRAVILGRMGTAYLRKGDLVRAQQVLEEAVAIASRTEGPRSGDVGMHLRRLAKVQYMRGDHAAATRNSELARGILQEALGAKDTERLGAVAENEVFRMRNAGSASSASAESAIAAWRGIYGKNVTRVPPDLADAMFLNAEYLLATGRSEEVVEALPPADGMLEQPLMQARREHLIAQANELRSPSAALAGYRRAIDIAEAKAGPNSAWVGLWRLDYAQGLMGAGRRVDAAKQLAAAGQGLKVQMVAQAPVIDRLDDLRRGTAVAAN